MNYKIELKKTELQPTLTMRELHPVEKLPDFFGKAYGGIMIYLQEIGKAPCGMPFAVYYNMDMQALDIEVGFTVKEKLPGKDEIIAGEISAGKYISTVYRGPYDSMEPAYGALTQWAEENGYTPSGIAYEYYLNDPDKNNGVIPITEIRFPVVKTKK